MDKLICTGNPNVANTQQIELGSQRSGNISTIDELYELYDELNEASDKGPLVNQYKNLFKAVHKGQKEKGLASQFITRFAEHFPDLKMETVNALLDICEDADVTLRKQAEKDLVTVCKKLPTLVPLVADVFAQILQTDNAGELSIVHNSLMSLFYINPEGALAGICAQIITGEPVIRDRCFKFFLTKYKNLGPEIMSPEFEKYLFKEFRKIVKVVETREQFMIIMDILNSTKMAKTEEGRRAFLEMIQALFKKNVRISDSEDISKLLVLVDFVFPFFHEENSSAFIFAYFCNCVLPKIQHLSRTDENDYFSVLKMTVDLSMYIGNMDGGQLKLCLMSLLKVLDGFLFEAPNNPDDDKIPLYNFSFIEGLLYLINKLGLIQPPLLMEVLKSQENFRPKIAFLLRVVVTYKIKLRKTLADYSLAEKKNNLEKLFCLRSIVNVALVSLALYRTEAPFAEKLRLSWKISIPSLSDCSSPIVTRGSKRKVTLVKRSCLDETDESSQNCKKLQDNEAKLYQPPNGKYSGRTVGYDDNRDSSSKRYRRRRYESTRSGRSASEVERLLVRQRGRY